MAVKIRLRRMGAKKAPFYRVIVADERSPRDGKFIDEIGYYNPLTNPAEIKINAEKAEQWLKNGAQPTETVKSLLKKSGVRTIELGAQSMDNSVLIKAGRGHTSADVENASRLIKERGFSLVLQMLTHLPSSDDEKDIETARKIACLTPDAVRIYPTVVVRDTALEEMWRCGKYTPATPEDAAKLGAKLIEIFEEKNIPIIRFGLNPTEDLSDGDALAGAYHPALGEMAQSARYLSIACKEIEKQGLSGGDITIFVSPSRVSAMSGIRKQNKVFLSEKYGFENISVKGDSSLESGEIRLEKSCFS